MRRPLAAAAVAVLVGAGVILGAQQRSPDLILTNGKVITVDDKFTIAQAVAITGDRFSAVGTNQQITQLAGASTRRIDLHGRSVVPGLIDNHMHLLRGGTTWTNEVRLDGVDSRKQALDLFAARAKAIPAGEWVYNIGGWSVDQFADSRAKFTREELDRLLPNHPVALQESYYRTYLNSRGLEAFGIRDGAPDPADFPKGSIVRDTSGRATGVVEGGMGAVRAIAAKMPRVADAQLEASTLAMLKDMNRAGLTTFGVAGCDPALLPMYRKWQAQHQLNVRIFCIDGIGAGTPEQVDRALPRIAEIKLFQGDDFIDSVLYGESVYGPLHDPMFDSTSDPKPEQLMQWRRLAMEIAKDRLPLHVHAELTHTIDAFLDQIEAVNKVYPVKNLRWMLAHFNQSNAAQMARMKRLGMYAAVHPWNVINGGIMHDIFGDDAYEQPPLATIQASGMMWGFGSDGSAANQYMPFITLHYAVTGKMASGLKVMRQTIGREDALIAYTRHNAFFVFQENNLGAIQQGKLADLVVLDRDYLTVPADQIKNIKPVMTMVGGRVVFEED
ncbi:MAG TPA: amidohydrolase [Vicinamibacterales bacterium]|jgi:predicted amidohydrolase YtcJ|nr:amidohydrolase [Vicinamibacterales bacterium]